MNTKCPAGPLVRESSYLIRLFIYFSIALAPASFLLTACSFSKAEQAAPGSGARSEGVPVITGVVTQKDVPLELRVIGAVEAYSVVAVKSQVGGELIKAHFTEGQFVNKGDTLFTIDPRPFETSLKQTEANLAKSTALEKQAEANLARDLTQSKNASAQANRYATLLESGVVSRDQYDQFRTTADALAETVRADKANVETAQKAIEADRATVQSARLQLSFTTVSAPIDGRTGCRATSYSGAVLKEAFYSGEEPDESCARHPGGVVPVESPSGFPATPPVEAAPGPPPTRPSPPSTPTPRPPEKRPWWWIF